MLAVSIKLGIQQTADILDHNRPRLDLRRKPEQLRKHVPLVLLPKLSAGHAERRAGKAAGEQVNPFPPVWQAVETGKIAFDYIPLRTVEPQCGAGPFVNLNQCCMFKPGLFQPQSLAAAACANLD